MSAPGAGVVEVDAGAVWRLTFEARGLWAPPRVWRSDEDGRVEIHAVPTGALVGRLVPTGDGELPEELSTRFQPAGAGVTDGGGPESERYTIGCRVHPEGRFECALPAGHFDLRLRSPGFVSHYLWNVAVPAGAEESLGDLRLVPGASVVAWVKSEGEPPDFDVTRAEAELVPETSGVESVARDHERRRLLALEEHPDSRGFVHFAGVGPGSYRLRVSHPELAETSFAPLVVAPGAETELHEVVLRPPVRLTVELEPPRDVRRRPWIVALSRHGDVPGHLDRVAIGGAGREGRWRQDGLDSGRYRLVVADASGARWATRDLDLDGADHDVRIELPFERIEGRVTLGGEVLEGATVWFGGRHGETRISAVSDEEGAVYVIVPVREAWPIDVRAEEPPVVARLDAVEVHDHPAQPWRRVEIELPGTALGGVVVKEEGDPVAGATVRVMREEPPVRFFIETSDEEGRFSLEALKSGRWRAQAEWRDGEGRRWLSDGVAASVAADRGEQVRLVLRPPWTFSGQIVGPGGGGVFGAEVTGVPVYPQPGERSTYVDTAVTGFSGEFAIDVPAEATAVRLTVLPPGYAAMQWPPFERDSPPRVLAVDGNGGTLRIEGLPVLATARVEELPGIFGLDRWSVGTLVRWARMAGGDPGSGEEGVLVVPSMSAGRYIVCPGGTSPAAAAAGGEGCISGELLPYSELTLTAPSP